MRVTKVSEEIWTEVETRLKLGHSPEAISGRLKLEGWGSVSHKGVTLGYRKIQDLEFNSLFRAYTDRALFQDICAHVYGEDTPIACFRAMFMKTNASRNVVALASGPLDAFGS